MKKVFVVLIVLASAIFFTSCDKTCTCINPDSEVTEIDALLMEDCQSLSNDVVGDCF